MSNTIEILKSIWSEKSAMRQNREAHLLRLFFFSRVTRAKRKRGRGMRGGEGGGGGKTGMGGGGGGGTGMGGGGGGTRLGGEKKVKEQKWEEQELQ
ncbi:hypothetical protein PoB_000877000 [Plakobranchus ocellatus]|uniref:Uncharacterized protein n=1 Tax=Plakobranchus ocellatus TaxID=259542 RepID=A0AAV3YGQ9_9GAST|nr:hypothetical protein PoB_000877000 [Plakobranchus ocellatus]